MGILDEIRKTQQPVKKLNGLVWLTMLIEYDLDGNAKCIRSFSKQAKESDVKNIWTKKDKKQEPSFVIEEEKKEKRDLFDIEGDTDENI